MVKEKIIFGILTETFKLFKTHRDITFKEKVIKFLKFVKLRMPSLYQLIINCIIKISFFSEKFFFSKFEFFA